MHLQTSFSHSIVCLACMKEKLQKNDNGNNPSPSLSTIEIFCEERAPPAVLSCHSNNEQSENQGRANPSERILDQPLGALQGRSVIGPQLIGQN